MESNKEGKEALTAEEIIKQAKSNVAAKHGCYSWSEYVNKTFNTDRAYCEMAQEYASLNVADTLENVKPIVRELELSKKYIGKLKSQLVEKEKELLNFPKDRNEQVNWLIVNCLRMLDAEQAKMVADNIYERIPKSEVSEVAEKDKEIPSGSYKFYKSSQEGMADVFHNNVSLGIWPFNIAKDLCTAANSHYDLIAENARLKSEVAESRKENDKSICYYRNLVLDGMELVGAMHTILDDYLPDEDWYNLPKNKEAGERDYSTVIKVGEYIKKVKSSGILRTKYDESGELVSTEKEIQPTMRTFEGHIKMLALEFEEAGNEYEANIVDPVVNAKGENTSYFRGKSDAYKYVKGKLNAALKWYGKATLAN